MIIYKGKILKGEKVENFKKEIKSRGWTYRQGFDKSEIIVSKDNVYHVIVKVEHLLSEYLNVLINEIEWELKEIEMRGN